MGFLLDTKEDLPRRHREHGERKNGRMLNSKCSMQNIKWEPLFIELVAFTHFAFCILTFFSVLSVSPWLNK
jgi:hypothetical protein